jgi:Uma2 family endonuclease
MSSALQAKHRWTYSDLVALPDDQLRHELIDGEHFVSPSPTTTHQEISKRLFLALNAHAARHRLGEVLYAPFDVKLSAWTVLVPDLVFFTAARFAEVVNEKHATAAPDLVVEILSPGTRRRDLGRKRAVYDREGVREYWTVDPEAQTITALRRPRPGGGLSDVVVCALAARDTLESPLFPGLKIRLRDVFGPARGTAFRLRSR